MGSHWRESCDVTNRNEIMEMYPFDNKQWAPICREPEGEEDRRAETNMFLKFWGVFINLYFANHCYVLKHSLHGAESFLSS